MRNPFQRNEMAKPTSQIGKTLKAWRLAVRPKLSRREAGELLGVDQMTVYRWETGAIGRLKLENAIGVSKAYGKPLAEVMALLGIEDSDTSIRATWHVSEGSPVSAGAPVELLLAEVRREAMHYNVRRAGGATDDELKILREKTELSIAAVLRAGAPSYIPPRDVIAGFFDLMTLESRPPLGEQPVAKRSRTPRESATPRKRKAE